jgi:hypothetical protein
MRYMLLYKTTEESPGCAGTAPNPALMAAMDDLIGEMTRTGTLLATDGLRPSAEGKRMRLAGGRVTVTDGPFTETKELIAGYAIVRVRSEAEAVALAQRFLEIHGTIFGPSYVGESEIRRMYDAEDFAPHAVIHEHAGAQA